MSTEENNLNKLRKLFALMDEDTLTKEDFVLHFEKVVGHVSEFRDQMGSTVQAIAKKMDEYVQTHKVGTSADFAAFKGEMAKLISDRFVPLSAQYEQHLATLDQKVAALDNAEVPDERIIRQTLERLPEIEARKPEETRDELESLVGDERLKIEAVKNLREELDDIRKLVKKASVFVGAVGGGGGGGGGKIMKYYDVSDQLNGVKTTFSLPSFWRVINVQSSSSPIPMRPDIHYTTDAGAMTITFTAEIDATTTLSAGQSIIVLYAEA